jgi:hypothetical protein
MSLATLKKKTQAKYNNVSVNTPAFSLNGTTRNQGYIGQTSLSRSLPKTIFKGTTPHGNGGCCGTFTQANVVQSGVDYQNNSFVTKKSVLNTRGMIANRKYRYLDDAKKTRVQIVKSDNNHNNNNQTDYVLIKKENTISEVDSSLCEPSDFKSQCHNEDTRCVFQETNYKECALPCYTQLNRPKRYKFINSKNLYDTFSQTKDVSTMSQSDYLVNMRKKCFSEELVNRSKSNSNMVTFPTGCGN